MQSSDRPSRSIPTGTVSGLGVVDAVRLDLLAIQIPALTSELESLRAHLETALQEAEAAMSEREAEREEEMSRRTYALRLVDLMLAEVPAASGDERVAFVGPTGMTTEVVTGALRQAIDEFSCFLDDRKDAEFLDRLREHSAAVAAWVETYLDLREVERFDFDPEAGANATHFW